MAETSKAHDRHVALGYFEKYFVGNGLDIGAGDDPVTPDCDIVEKRNPDNGIPPVGHTLWICDASKLDGVPRNRYDFAYASHVLEHMEDPVRAIRAWYEVLKPGGYLFVSVPHRDYYERKTILPSRWNADHKCYWLPNHSEPPVTWSLREVINRALSQYIVLPDWGLGFEVEPTAYVLKSDAALPVYEHAQGEYSIECIVHKSA